VIRAPKYALTTLCYVCARGERYMSSSSVYLSAPKLKSPKRFKPEGIGPIRPKPSSPKAVSFGFEGKGDEMLVWNSGEIRRSLQFHQNKKTTSQRKMLRSRSHDLFDHLVVSYKYLFLKH